MNDQEIAERLMEMSIAATNAANSLSEMAAHCRVLAEAVRRKKGLRE